MAPEQLAGQEVTVRSDIYAWDWCYESSPGNCHSIDTAGLMRALALSVSAPRLSTRSGPVVGVILRCLAKRDARPLASPRPAERPRGAALAAGKRRPEMVAAAGARDRRLRSRCDGAGGLRSGGAAPARWSRWGRSTDRRCGAKAGYRRRFTPLAIRQLAYGWVTGCSMVQQPAGRADAGAGC